MDFPSDVIQEIAIARFEPMKTKGTLTPLDVLVEQFRERLNAAGIARVDRFVIQKMIAQAFGEKSVVVERRDNLPVQLPPLDPALAAALRKEFPSLQAAVVIRSMPGGQTDDTVHANLGAAMADYIAHSSVIQRNDVIGVGSGRGVGRTIEALHFSEKLPADNVTLMSLTGSVYSSPRSNLKGLWFDADRHTSSLSTCFENNKEPVQYLIVHPLAFETPDAMMKARKRVWLGHPEESRPAMTHTLLGTGVFAPGPPKHRFYTEASTINPKDREPFLESIHKDLVSLKTACDEIRAIPNLPESFRDYSPAAEMSNVFFFVPPPPGFPPEKDHLLQKIQQSIDDINNAILTVSTAEIKSTRMILVAGTKRKAHAIRALLKTFPVTFLCTDAEAAKAILALGK